MSSAANIKKPDAPVSRPFAVSLVALLVLIGALSALVAGAYAYSSRDTLLSLVRNETVGSGLSVTVTLNDILNFAFILIGYGIIHLAIAFGIWTGQNWARIVSMVLSIIGLLASLPALYLAPELVAVVAFALFVLYYFTRPRIKEFFKIQSRTVTSKL